VALQSRRLPVLLALATTTLLLRNLTTTQAANAHVHPQILYETNWRNGLAGWTASDHSWTVTAGLLHHNGQHDTKYSRLIASFTPRTSKPYAEVLRVQAGTDHDTDSGSGPGGGGAFGLLVHASPKPQGGWAAAGINYGERPDIWAPGTDQYRDKQYLTPGTGWHVIRVDVWANHVSLTIDGAVEETATLPAPARGTNVGITARGFDVTISRFAVVALAAPPAPTPTPRPKPSKPVQPHNLSFTFDSLDTTTLSGVPATTFKPSQVAQVRDRWTVRNASGTTKITIYRTYKYPKGKKWLTLGIPNDPTTFDTSPGTHTYIKAIRLDYKVYHKLKIIDKIRVTGYVHVRTAILSISQT
jgi:hypothetical protein